MASTAIISFLYGAVLVAGGLMGYAKSGSLPSLYAGCISGLSVMGIEYLFSKNMHSGSIIQSSLALGLGLLMYSRYSENGKFMPAGLVATLSVGMTFVYASRVIGLTGKSHTA